MDPIKVAKDVIVDYWRFQGQMREQEHWSGVIAEGLVDQKTAENWADEVWVEERDPDDGDLDDW